MRYIGFLTNIANSYNKIPTKDVVEGTKLANTYNMKWDNYQNEPKQVIEKNISQINFATNTYELAEEAKLYKMF